MKDTVILYGTNTFTRHLIDWTRTDCEYWCWNEVGSLKDDRPNYWAKRVDCLIQIHVPPIWRNHYNLNHGRQQSLGEMQSNSHYDWLQREHDFPVYMQDHYDDVPSSVKYPKDEIVKKLLPNLYREVAGNIEQVENFTSSFAYAVALALYQDVKKIEIAGIEMTSDTEYVRQRPGGYFWIGLATGRGVEVCLHSPLLMKDKLYGYTGEVMIQRQEFEMSLRKQNELVEVLKSQAFEAKGRTQAILNALLKTTSQTDGERLAREFIISMNDAQAKTFEYGQMAGRHEENLRYMKECDELISAAGGEKALQVLMQNTPVKIESELQDVEKV